MSSTTVPIKQPARVVTLCFLVALVDGYDAQSVGYVGPRLIEDFGIGRRRWVSALPPLWSG